MNNEDANDNDTTAKTTTKEPSSKDRLAALEAKFDKVLDANVQKDAQIADLVAQNKKLVSAGNGTSKAQQEADALALRNEREKRLSTEIGGMTVSHAVATDITEK